MNEIEDEMKIRAEELFKGTALSKDKTLDAALFSFIIPPEHMSSNKIDEYYTCFKSKTSSESMRGKKKALAKKFAETMKKLQEANKANGIKKDFKIKDEETCKLKEDKEAIKKQSSNVKKILAVADQTLKELNNLVNETKCIPSRRLKKKFLEKSGKGPKIDKTSIRYKFGDVYNGRCVFAIRKSFELLGIIAIASASIVGVFDSYVNYGTDSDYSNPTLARSALGLTSLTMFYWCFQNLQEWVISIDERLYPQYQDPSIFTNQRRIRSSESNSESGSGNINSSSNSGEEVIDMTNKKDKKDHLK